MRAAVEAPPERQTAALRVLKGIEPSPGTVNQEKVHEPYMTLRELAKALGFSPCTLWRYGIPGRNLGGRRRYRRSEVEAYFNSQAFRTRVEALQRARKIRK